MERVITQLKVKKMLDMGKKTKETRRERFPKQKQIVLHSEFSCQFNVFMKIASI